MPEEMGPTPDEQGPQFEMTKVQSSNIRAIGYDEESQTLRVEFNSGHAGSYADVPVDKYERMRLADSVGKFINAEIKPLHKWTPE